jgi:phage terminase Nu1 subunit (DNA packaging protein)
MTAWGSAGSADNQFNGPVGIAVDSSGYVFVVDDQNHRIQKFTSDGVFVTKWGGFGNQDGQFYYPWGIATDNSGFLYVADALSRVQKFTSDGVFVTKWGNFGNEDDQFTEALTIEVDNSGFVYLLDRTLARVQKFTSDGVFVTKWGSEGSGDSQFSYPIGMAIDNSGFVYVTDSMNHRVQKFTSDGVFVTKWGSGGSENGQFSEPRDIHIDSSGIVYVADSSNHRIQVFSSSGVFITKWGVQGSGVGQFQYPQCVTSDASRYIYVSDYLNNRIQKFQRIQTNPPTLSSLSPSGSYIGSAGFTLVVSGSSFINGATVMWDGNDRATTFVSSSEIRATIDASDIDEAKTVSVTARNPGSAASNVLGFTINNELVPSLISLTPPNATVGGMGFNLIVNGSSFVSGATVMWDGNDRATTFTGNSEVRATISASDIAVAKNVSVTVRNPGGASSNALSFVVNYPVPGLVSLSPTSAAAGNPAFVLSAYGTGFINGATVMWDGSDRPTSFVRSTELAATIGATDIASAKSVQITACNPGSGASNALGFTVTNPLPSITALVPSSVVAGSQGFTLSVTGSRFVSGAVVRWNGSARPTTFVNGNEVDAAISASDILEAKTVPITVRNPDGGISNALNFAVNNPSSPALTSLSPARVTGGGAGFTLTLIGSNFVTNSVVRWNGVNKTTTYVSSTELRAAILAADIASGGNIQVTVANPLPAGSTSNALDFLISSFTLNSSPSSVAVSPGQTAAYAIQVTPNGGSFDSSVSFKSSGLPSNTTASIAPANVVPGPNVVATTLTIVTKAASKSSIVATLSPGDGVPPVLWLLLPILAFMGWLGLCKPLPRKLFSRWLTAGALVCMFAFIGSCGAGGKVNPPPDTRTPSGTYQITVQGESGSQKTSTSVTLIVN